MNQDKELKILSTEITGMTTETLAGIVLAAHPILNLSQYSNKVIYAYREIVERAAKRKQEKSELVRQHCELLELAHLGIFTHEPTQAESPSALDTQHGGDHYKKLGIYQPWEVLRHWLTPEEFKGYMKGTAIAYLAREEDKGKLLDIQKATHTLEALIEMIKPDEGGDTTL